MEEEIEAIEKIGATKRKLLSGGGPHEPNRVHFEKHLAEETNPAQQAEYTQQYESSKVAQIDQSEPLGHSTERKASAIDEVFGERRAEVSERIPKSEDDLRTLLAATEQMQSRLNEAKGLISSPNAALTPATEALLSRKLGHINDGLKSALSSVGADFVAKDAPQGLTGPLQKFLGLLTHGQDQLANLGKELSAMEAVGSREISPSKMLGLQIKVGFIQQEIELFTAMLTKTVDSLKTLMNTQI